MPIQSDKTEFELMMEGQAEDEEEFPKVEVGVTVHFDLEDAISKLKKLFGGD